MDGFFGPNEPLQTLSISADICKNVKWKNLTKMR